MNWEWVLKINGKREAHGWCLTKDDAVCEAGRYFAQYTEEDFVKIELIIKERLK